MEQIWEALFLWVFGQKHTECAHVAENAKCGNVKLGFWSPSKNVCPFHPMLCNFLLETLSVSYLRILRIIIYSCITGHTSGHVPVVPEV